MELSAARPTVTGSRVDPVPTRRGWWAAIAVELGPQEIGLLVAVALVAVGGWAIYPPLGCLLPGVVLLWVFIPSRASFVLRPDVTDDRPRKAKAVQRPSVGP